MIWEVFPSLSNPGILWLRAGLLTARICISGLHRVMVGRSRKSELSLSPTLSLNMLQRTLGLGELFVLELVVRSCSVNEQSGVAVVSPGTRWSPAAHLRKLDVFCKTVL